MNKSSFSKRNNKKQNSYNSGWVPAVIEHNNLERNDYNNRSKKNVVYYESQNQPKQRSYFFQNFLIIILFTYLIVSYLSPKVTVDEPIINNHNQAKHCPDSIYFFNLYGKKADETYISTFNKYSNENNEICDNYKNYLRQFSDSLAAEKCTYSNCTKLIAYLAKDQVTGSTSGSDYLNELFGDSLDDKMDYFIKKINGNLADYQEKMQQISHNYAYEICTNLPPTSILHFEKNERFESIDFDIALANLGLEGALNTAALIFDAKLIISSGLFRSLRKYIVDIAWIAFKGPIKKASASVAASLLDGPLPIGDIIGAVGVVWTAYDISCMRADFQKQVADSIYNKFSEEINNVREQSNSSISNIYSNYRQIRNDMEKEFRKEYQQSVNHS